jgi:hypothetical protein
VAAGMDWTAETMALEGGVDYIVVVAVVVVIIIKIQIQTCSVILSVWVAGSDWN